MPKPLREPQPTSAVSKLFDAGAAARAVSRPEALPTPTAQPTPVGVSTQPTMHAGMPAFPHAGVPATGEPANLKRELVLSPSTDETFTNLVDLFKRSTGTRLTSSHVARGLLKGIEKCLPTIQREARQIGPLRLPSNARGREGEREQFEERIAQAIVAGIRAAPAYEPNE